MGLASPSKETTTTTKVRPNFLVEVKIKTYYGLRTMSKKYKKCRQLERIIMHLQNAPMYYVKYKEEEN